MSEEPTQVLAPAKPKKERRDGYFKLGGKPGPGRPPREVEQKYLCTFRAGCSLDDFLQVVRVVVKRAKAGNLIAAKILFDRMLPAKRLEDLGFTPQQVNVVVLNDAELAARRESLREAITA